MGDLASLYWTVALSVCWMDGWRGSDTFVAVASSISRTFHSLLGPARGWKAVIAHSGSSGGEQSSLTTDTADVMREMDTKVEAVTAAAERSSTEPSMPHSLAQSLTAPLSVQHPAALVIHEALKGQHQAHGTVTPLAHSLPHSLTQSLTHSLVYLPSLRIRPQESLIALRLRRLSARSSCFPVGLCCLPCFHLGSSNARSARWAAGRYSSLSTTKTAHTRYTAQRLTTTLSFTALLRGVAGLLLVWLRSLCCTDLL